MDEGEEPNLPPAPPPLDTGPNFINRRPFNPDSTASTTTPSSSSFPNAFLRNVQAAFKHHRHLGMMPSNNIKPRRMFVPQRGTPKDSTSITGSTFNTRKVEEESLLSQRLRDCASETKNMVSLVGETPEDASITPPMEWASVTNTCEESSKQLDVHCEQPRSFPNCRSNDTVASSIMESKHVSLLEESKKVHFATQNDARLQGADESMTTGIDDLLSHLDSLAFSEMEWDGSNQTDVPTAISQDLRQQSKKKVEVDEHSRANGVSSSLENLGFSDQLKKFSNFMQNDTSQPMTLSSVVGLSCATTTSINPGYAPMLSSVTYFSEPHQPSCSKLNLGTTGTGDAEMNYQLRVQPEMLPFDLPSNCNSKVLGQQTATGGKVPSSNAKTCLEVKNSVLPNDKESLIPKDSSTAHNPFPHGENAALEIQKPMLLDAPMSNVQASDSKLESNKSGKQGKSVGGKASSTSRKKTYDADLFFKVNGKLYQRLGKIGSGGSSEVHKVISSDCTIYALKKIKLKGRDYATAYGFCQEIEYLNKLKGKNNIIQLVDYEVTDKALLQEVISGSMINKDGRVKEDGCIYMVLEYGEIDLAHMLSQKWKELDSSNSTIDENWLRFYWQQILLAANTIHEERIVHSDLKPANFLLVRGSLKLIDFGIAKVIMSDTTNIQRDSQVGTLSYMSPEAFMCNETDSNGNTIKCGRPSDIWSLGCILYQMVYGRTPFSDYKTFWAKFKVITDPSHEITYEPVSNPWLMDLMKKCLAWDRNQRWRIPQLLQHPFLVPPIPSQVPTPADHSCRLLQLIAKSCEDDPTALMMYSQLEQLLKDPRPSVTAPASTIPHSELQKLFLDMSNLCLQLHKQLTS